MNSENRLLIFCDSLQNPFVEAWVITWLATHSQVVVLADIAKSETADFPQEFENRVVYTRKQDGTIWNGWRERAEEVLGGQPQALFYWWGLALLSNRTAIRAWPSARVISCVDTLPNASRWITEVREIGRAFSRIRDVDAFVVTSQRMADLIRAEFPSARRKPMEIVLSPFPLRAHSGGVGRSSVPRDDEAQRLCFTGRSDYLFAGQRKMGKDDLGSWFRQLLHAGFEIHVQEPNEREQRRVLGREGLNFYPRIKRSGLLNGEFADLIAAFDGHLVYYQVGNSTIARRVATSLSTRFATGVCSSTPMITPPEAIFAIDFFEQHRIGFASRSGEEIAERLLVDGGRMRSTWREDHLSWSGESNAQRLSLLAFD
jgi:hypothetical protein